MKVQKLLKTVTLIVGTLSLLGSLTYAADLAQRGPISFDIYDVNKDGLVSKKEFYDARTKRMTIRSNQGLPMRNASNAPAFTQFDTDKDGKLSKIELLEGQNAQMQSRRLNRGAARGMGQNQR